ncbi:ABC transporter permease [Advenella sp. S44]|uniref:TRAP transporter large permease n=1 Tax=Advenella sp. S44 TaxID=1982755 RepID=UPI000C2A3A12|nr:ABC transporter permease [Advenella sp. S44]
MLCRSVLAVKTAVMRLVGLLAVVMLVFESTLLFTGVVFRYFLHQPIIWSDELAQSVFIWLCMFGAALALDRHEHMRLTAVVARFSRQAQNWFETLGLVIILLFAAYLIGPGFHHAAGQMVVTSPALDIPDGYRALAIPVGMCLFTFIALSHLLAHSRLQDIVSAAAVVAVVGYALWYFADFMYDIGNLNLIVFFVLVLGACVMSGVPIAFCFGIATLAYIVNIAEVPPSIVVTRIDEGASHLVLLAVPLFVVLGVLLQISGMARKLIDFMSSVLGHIRGGLNYVLLGAMFLVSGISGSKVADMAAVAPALFPEMKRKGADENDLAALLSATGAMTETIPPSLVLITIGAVCGVSISALFIGGLVPALVCTLAIAFVCYLKSRRNAQDTRDRAKAAEIGRTFVWALPVLVLPIIIRVCVVEGVATATEVASIGIVYVIIYAIIVQLATGGVEKSRIYPMLIEATSLSGAILLIIGVATAMAWALTQSGFSTTLVEFMTHIPGGVFGFMTVSIVLFVLLGSILEGIPAIVLFGPLIFPAAQAMHIHEVHYAIVIILAMGIGLFAPPLGVGFYSASAISKVNPDKVIPKMWLYLAVLLATTFVIAFVPWFSIGFL